MRKGAACLVVCLLFSTVAFAQEAVISGTVADATGAVLPGVTVTAVMEGTGNSFVGVTDERGTYRIPVRIGTFKISAELAGFSTVTREGLEVLVGQQEVVNLRMAVAGLAETLTVTGQGALIDTTQSKVGTNIDPRQMQELPVNGRNWLGLATLAQGARTAAITDSPVQNGAAGGVTEAGNGPAQVMNVSFQLNVDGQQVTQLVGSTQGQPSYSRDAIAEFQFVANRFDATQGRSSGVQVNAVTKSGTNRYAGSLAGYFRSDTLNAADFMTNTVLPYSDQQISTTLGGPIRRDRIHFFGSYEYERNPQTYAFLTPFAGFNSSFPVTERQHKALGRLDAQLSTRTRGMIRGQYWDDPETLTSGAPNTRTSHPASLQRAGYKSRQLFGTLTQVLNNHLVHEVKAGYSSMIFGNYEKATYSGSPMPATSLFPANTGMPAIQFLGFTAGNPFSPYEGRQGLYTVRDDLTYSFTKAGRHDLKLGADYGLNRSGVFICNRCMPLILAFGGPPPANLDQILPMDPNQWNLAALSPITTAVQITIGPFDFPYRQHMVGAWVQDDWAVSPRLTVNAGLRWDLLVGAFNENMKPELWVLPPWQTERPSEKHDFGPRLGAAFQLNDKTVLRGGFGIYYSQVQSSNNFTILANKQQVVALIPNDGRPDFAANPFNGPPPSFEQAAALAAAAGTRSLLLSIAPGAENAYSYQAGAGVQRQLGNTMSVNADYVYTGGRNIGFTQNINMTYNPATGANYPFTDRSRRVDPSYGPVQSTTTNAYTNFHALETAFTKRFSHRWQASGTYTWSILKDGVGAPGFPTPVTFPVAADIGNYYTLSAGDTRHRAVFNGIWDVGHGFQTSALYYASSGQRFPTTYGGYLRNDGNLGANRLRPDGTIVPRNNFVGQPLHRVDFRAQQRIPLGNQIRLEGIAEVFNVFNHENYGNYVTVESSPLYAQPVQPRNVAFFPRMAQLGFRLTF